MCEIRAISSLIMDYKFFHAKVSMCLAEVKCLDILKWMKNFSSIQFMNTRELLAHKTLTLWSWFYTRDIRRHISMYPK